MPYIMSLHLGILITSYASLHLFSNSLDFSFSKIKSESCRMWFTIRVDGINYMRIDRHHKGLQTVAKLLFCSYVWHIWIERNRRIIKAKFTSASNVANSIIQTIQSIALFIGISFPNNISCHWNIHPASYIHTYIHVHSLLFIQAGEYLFILLIRWVLVSYGTMLTIRLKGQFNLPQTIIQEHFP